MVKSFIISLVIVILCFGCKEVPEQKTIFAQKGILDLTNVSFQETEIVNLDGDWDFYWKKFLSYEEILENKKKPDLYDQAFKTQFHRKMNFVILSTSFSSLLKTHLHRNCKFCVDQ